MWKIELLLRKYANCDDVDVKLMAQKMQTKFAKYWDQYIITLAMGAALDPRLKLQIYCKVDPSTSEEKVQIVRDNLILLFKEYKTESESSPLDDDLNDVSIFLIRL